MGRDDKPFEGTHHGYDGYEPGYVDELIAKRIGGELSDKEWAAELEAITIFEEITQQDRPVTGQEGISHG